MRPNTPSRGASPRNPAGRNRAPQGPRPGKGPNIRHPGGGRRGRGPGGNPVTDPLSPKAFRREVQATTNLQVRPLERQLGAEFQGSVVREQQQIPSWFADYQAKLNQYAQNTQAAYNQANQQFGNYLQSANTQDVAARSQVDQRAQADAAQRGANVSNLASQQAANANARRADLGAFQGGVMGTQGANAYAYLQNRGAIGAREKIDQQQQEALRRQKIVTDQRALAQKRGDIANQARQDLRKSERDYLIQQMAFTTPTAASRLSAQTSRQNAQLSSATSRRGQNISAASSAATRRAELQRQKQKQRFGLQHPTSSGTPGGRSPAEKHSDRQAFHNALSGANNLYQQYAAQNKAPRTDKEWANFTTVLVHGGGSISALGGSNPHLWASKAVKRLRQRQANQAQTHIPGVGNVGPFF